jgi:hypothetical protein
MATIHLYQYCAFAIQASYLTILFVFVADLIWVLATFSKSHLLTLIKVQTRLLPPMA